MYKKIALNMKIILLEHNRTSIWYGDLSLIEECANRSMLKLIHPQKNIQRILNALDKSDLFEKKYIISDISGYNRKYRCFKIK